MPVLDGRSQAAKRIAALVQEFTVRLGNPKDPIIIREIRTAAELVVVYERRRALMLAETREGRSLSMPS